MTEQFVFSFGSLVSHVQPGASRAAGPDGFIADLPGFRRCWGVAMDNTEHVEGYKFYRDSTGGRPALMVAFLDLRPDPAGRVNGLCRPVSDVDLETLDRRERNYTRVDVSPIFSLQLPGRYWLYVGNSVARSRARTGLAENRLAVPNAYYTTVVSAFSRLGEDDTFHATTDYPGRYLRALTRVDIPQSA